MSNRLDYFFRQIVTESELDLGFDQMEQAINDTMADQQLIGMWTGAQVSEHSPTPDLTVDVAGPAIGRDKDGNRLFFSPLQNLDMSVDESNVTTSVGTPGNEKTLAIFLAFDRALSDPRLDGNNDTVFFLRSESFVLNVVQSAEAAIGLSVPPAIRIDEILLADVVIINAQTQIFNADIDDARREDVFDLTGSPNAIKTGRVNDALQDMLDILNAGATGVSYAGGGNWADGTTNPATDVEAQLDKMIDDLAATTAANDGTAKIGGEVLLETGETVLTAGDLRAQMTELADGRHTDRTWIFGPASGNVNDATSAANDWNFDEVNNRWDNAAATPLLVHDLIPLPVGDKVVVVQAYVSDTAGADDLQLLLRTKSSLGAGAPTTTTLDTQLTSGSGGFQLITFSFTPFVLADNEFVFLEIQPDTPGSLFLYLGARAITRNVA